MSFEQANNALVAGIVLGSIGAGSPGVAGNIKADLKHYKGAIIAPNILDWMLSMGKESKAIIDRDVIEWVYRPDGVQLTPCRFLYR